MSTTYNIIYSSQAFLDLSELYKYIRFTLQVPKRAKKQVSRIRKTIRSLNTMPMRHPLVEWESRHSVGIRRVPTDNYTAFYLVDADKCSVTVVRIFYAGRNTDNIINNK